MAGRVVPLMGRRARCPQRGTSPVARMVHHGPGEGGALWVQMQVWEEMEVLFRLHLSSQRIREQAISWNVKGEGVLEA